MSWGLVTLYLIVDVGGVCELGFGDAVPDSGRSWCSGVCASTCSVVVETDPAGTAAASLTVNNNV